MICLHIFTEEPSAKYLFEAILPKLVSEDVTFRIYPHQGKQDLENALRKTIPTISKIPGSRILITRDQDSADCKDVKSSIIEIIGGHISCPYLVRIVCKELESWFLGDLHAVSSAYPRVNPDSLRGKAEFRNVDKITTPHRHLLKIIPEYLGRGSLPKLECSENISKHLNINENRSNSFNQTISGIRKLLEIK
jgi:hypothetical protein